MNKKGKSNSGTFFIILLLAVGIYFYLFIYDNGANNPFKPKCGKEFQTIITGTLNSNGVCCEGLFPQTPNGYAGGAWCVKENFDVFCVSNPSIIGATQPGLYVINLVSGKINISNKYYLNATCPNTCAYPDLIKCNNREELAIITEEYENNRCTSGQVSDCSNVNWSS